MRITQEGDYAFRVVLYLCKSDADQKIEAKNIAQSENIPIRFLLKLLRKLVHAGIVKSYRGIGGGYAIAREPQAITLKDVIEAIEGPIYINRCLYDRDFCQRNQAHSCDIHRALNIIQKNLMADFEKITFEKILQKKFD